MRCGACRLRNRVVETFSFTRSGNGAPLLREGWGPAEEILTWSFDTTCTLALPPVNAAAGFVEVSGYPYEYEGCGVQTVVMTVNDRPAGTAHLRWLPTPFAIAVPTGVPLVIRFELPKAARPPHGHHPIALGLARVRVIEADVAEARPPRLMPGTVAIPYETPPERAGAMAAQHLGVDAKAVVTSFESIGVNCEFGLLQRIFAAEPLGLLRLAGIFPCPVLDGLDRGFEGIGDAIRMKQAGGHWHATDDRYGFVYHTPIPSEEPVEQAIATDRARLGFLRRVFFESMAAGEKVYVRHSNAPMTTADALPLFLGLNRRGPNTLLFVTPAEGHPPGTVEEIMPGLLRGHIDRLGDEGERWWISAGCWLELCVNALKLRGSLLGEVVRRAVKEIVNRGHGGFAENHRGNVRSVILFYFSQRAVVSLGPRFRRDDGGAR